MKRAAKYSSLVLLAWIWFAATELTTLAAGPRQIPRPITIPKNPELITVPGRRTPVAISEFTKPARIRRIPDHIMITKIRPPCAVPNIPAHITIPNVRTPIMIPRIAELMTITIIPEPIIFPSGEVVQRAEAQGNSEVPGNGQRTRNICGMARKSRVTMKTANVVRKAHTATETTRKACVAIQAMKQAKGHVYVVDTYPPPKTQREYENTLRHISSRSEAKRWIYLYGGMSANTK